MVSSVRNISLQTIAVARLWVLPPGCVEFVEFRQPSIQIDSVGLCSLCQCLLVPHGASLACGQVVPSKNVRGIGVVVPGLLNGHFRRKWRALRLPVAPDKRLESISDASHSMAKLMRSGPRYG